MIKQEKKMFECLKESNPNSWPLWLQCFPTFDCFPAMENFYHDNWYGESTWQDASYANDACPSFESRDLIKGKVVKLWSDWAEKNFRDTPDSKQYAASLYIDEGDGCIGDYIDTELRTDDINEVYEWILKQESNAIIAHRLALKGERKATIEDMRKSKKFRSNLYDAMDCNDPGLNCESGFTYFDNSFYIQLLANGKFYVMVGNQEWVTGTIEEAEVYLWNNFVESEAPAIKMGEYAIVFNPDLYDNCPSKIKPLNFFTDEHGYTDEHIKLISELGIGEHCYINGITWDNKIYRLK